MILAIKKQFYWQLLTLMLCFSFAFAQGADVNYSDFAKWQTIKDAHFVVYYYEVKDENLARDVLRKAEEFYDRVTYQLGHSRYGDFWTWEERVKIFIFPDQLSFALTTGQPLWSKGYAVRDSKLFQSRAIVTYQQQEGFIQNLLPHEIGHLVLKDMIGFDRLLPLWFEEGVAQLQEDPDPAADKKMIEIVKSNQHIPFEVFGDLDIRRERDQFKVAVFYAQSRMMLEFLIRSCGRDSFQRLCRNLKDGMDFNQALNSACSPVVDSLKSLTEKWIQDVRNK